jgi:hypothetical protein
MLSSKSLIGGGFEERVGERLPMPKKKEVTRYALVLVFIG